MQAGIKKGAVGADIERLQRILEAAGIAVDEQERRSSTFGPSTIDALKALQKRHGIPATGRLTAATTAMLAKAGPIAGAPPITVSPPITVAPPVTVGPPVAVGPHRATVNRP